MIQPTLDCVHLRTLFRELRAECAECGAYWIRQDDGPWRCVVAGELS